MIESSQAIHGPGSAISTPRPAFSGPAFSAALSRATDGERSSRQGVAADRIGRGASRASVRPEAATERSNQLERRETARQLASQLVSSAFIVPVLESMRESPFLEGPFAPGFAERRFAPMLDEQIADRIARASNFPLVDRIVDRLIPQRPDLPEGASP